MYSTFSTNDVFLSVRKRYYATRLGLGEMCFRSNIFSSNSRSHQERRQKNF